MVIYCDLTGATVDTGGSTLQVARMVLHRSLPLVDNCRPGQQPLHLLPEYLCLVMRHVFSTRQAGLAEQGQHTDTVFTGVVG